MYAKEVWSNRNLKPAKTSKTFVFCKYQSVNEYLWINPSNISLKIIPMRRKSSITIILPVGFDPSLQSSQPPKQIKINHQTNKFVNFLNVFAALDLPWVTEVMILCMFGHLRNETYRMSVTTSIFLYDLLP